MKIPLLCVFTLCIASTLNSYVSSYNLSPNRLLLNANANIMKTIVVDQSGNGDFSTVQQAIDSVPSGNNWIKINIKKGVYKEKVIIPNNKPKIFMEGEHVSNTIIQFSDAGEAINSATFRMLADNFIASHITFKNTHNSAWSNNDEKIMVAPAVVINGDKVVFQGCRFVSVQDTLADGLGRHYFLNCYIQGSIDFIWGRGQSIYMKCVINVTGGIGGTPGYITAQGRESEDDKSGFVFKGCVITGSSKAYLGRAYRKYSRVIFSRTNMYGNIVPEGWSAWNYKGQEEAITFVEVNCKGPGANQKGRVNWVKTLDSRLVKLLEDPKAFLDNDGWMEQLPLSIPLPV